MMEDKGPGVDSGEERGRLLSVSDTTGVCSLFPQNRGHERGFIVMIEESFRGDVMRRPLTVYEPLAARCGGSYKPCACARSQSEAGRRRSGFAKAPRERHNKAMESAGSGRRADHEQGVRGLARAPGAERGRRSRRLRGRSALDVERIWRWADAHRTATGRWPDRRSGPVGGVDDETWSVIDAALRRGRRGLPGGSSLARLLAEERGVTEGANPESPAERLRAWEAEQFPTAGHAPARA